MITWQRCGRTGQELPERNWLRTAAPYRCNAGYSPWGPAIPNGAKLCSTTGPSSSAPCIKPAMRCVIYASNNTTPFNPL